MYQRPDRNRRDIDPQQTDDSLISDDINEIIGNGRKNLLNKLLAGISNEANADEEDQLISPSNEANAQKDVRNPDFFGIRNVTIKEYDDDGPGLLDNIAPEDKELPKKEPQVFNEIKSGKKAEAPKSNKKDEDLAGIEKFTDIIKEEDIAHTDEDMSPVRGMDFVPQKLPARNDKPSALRRAASRLAYYGGKTVGALLGLIGNLIAAPYSFGRWIQQLCRRHKNSKQATKRDRDVIPGWDGRKFEEAQKNDRELDIDFRRVPAVWSYYTADKPVDSSGNVRPPVISVYVNQPDEEHDRTQNDNEGSGHTGIGIEYSRYSRVTGEWERYNLRYGFYPAGGLNNNSTKGLQGYEKAVIPGRLANEKGVSYTISRSYPATNKQVNAVLNASVPYVDKGYNIYTRNCTSFAKAMLLNVAHIPGSEAIFKRDEIQQSAKNNALMFGASMGTFHLETSAEADLNKLITGDDISYMNIGSKRMSDEEYKNYRNSLSYFKRRPKYIDSPNATAENIKRLSGKNVGTVGRYKPKDTREDTMEDTMEDTREKLWNTRKILQTGGLEIRKNLEEIIPAGSVDTGSLPEEYGKITGILEDLGEPISVFTLSMDPETFSRQDIRKMRSDLSEYIVLLNKLLYKYYENDKRLQKPVLNMISHLNEAILRLDYAYATVSDDILLGSGDLGSLRQEMNHAGYSISAGGKEVVMSPSLYEAYLQIFKTPEAAVKNYARYIELWKKDKDRIRLSDPEKKELEKLQRVRGVALDFDRSHRYMLEKKNFSQQDIDYAFELHNKEINNARSPELTNDHLFASDIYQSLFLEKVFPGLKGRFSSASDDAEEDPKMNLNSWLDDDLAKSVKKNKEEMTKFAKGAVKNVKNPTEENLKRELWGLIRDNYLKRLYPDGNKLEKEILKAFGRLSYGGKLGRALDPILEDIISDLPKEKREEEEVSED